MFRVDVGRGTTHEDRARRPIRSCARHRSRLGARRASVNAMVRCLAFVSVALTVATSCRSPDKPPSRASEVDPTSPVPAPKPVEPPTPGAPPTSEKPPPPTPNVPPEPPTVSSKEVLLVDGQERSFVLVSPTSPLPKTTYPLVLALHGDGGTGETMHATFAFESISKERAFVAYPTGTSGWNLHAPTERNPDLAFLTALVDSLTSNRPIDRTRIFATGFSSGAFMINQVGCRIPSLFRAIAPHSGGAPNEPNDPSATRWSNGYTRCTAQVRGEGPAVMVIHGTADTTVTFDSGAFAATYWAYVNGCATTHQSTATSSCVAYDACPADSPVVFCSIEDLGHSFWDDAATATWTFFDSL